MLIEMVWNRITFAFLKKSITNLFIISLYNLSVALRSRSTADCFALKIDFKLFLEIMYRFMEKIEWWAMSNCLNKINIEFVIILQYEFT